MTQYYERLIHAVKLAGLHRPALVIDAERLTKNLKTIREALPNTDRLRLADKSIPVPALLKQGFEVFGTQRVMSFHLPLTAQLLEHFPRAEILLGKPMPVAAAATFIDQTPLANQVTWLIDSAARLAEYRALAEQTETTLRIAFEVNIGLGRGGFAEPADLRVILGQTGQLKVCGLMGYEAHIHALPKILGGGQNAQAEAMRRLADFADCLTPDQREIINTAGSSTLLGLPMSGPANDFTIGSLMIKPSDFDQPINAQIEPAAFIVTPVLKTYDHQLPGHPRLTRILQKTGIIRDRIAFCYGGKWMADPVFPVGLSASPFFAPSSNQHGFCLPRHAVEPSQLVFRPTQSEAVLQQFPELQVFDGARISQTWRPFDVC